MTRPAVPLRERAVVISALSVSVMLIAGALVFFGWDSAGGPSSVPVNPLPHLSITFVAYTNAQVETLLTTAQPYIEPGDSFDLGVGTAANGSANTTSVNRWAQELSATYPDDVIYAHTSGLENYANVVRSVGPQISGVGYDYEPNYEPEFTFNFSQTVTNFDNASALAHAQGLLSTGIPTGRPVLEGDLQQYQWNYAVLGHAVDRLVVQTETYCAQGPLEFANATSKVIGQYAEAAMTNLPTFQITIGNATTSLRNGVSAARAYGCAEELTDQELRSLFLFWDDGSASNVVEFLQEIGRG